MFLCKLLYLSALLLILVPLIISLPHPHHDVHKRSSFFDIDCKGMYELCVIGAGSLILKLFMFCILGVFNKSIFFRLDRICEDCYSLFREVELHSLCKWVSSSNRFVKEESLSDLYRVPDRKRSRVSWITQGISDYLNLSPVKRAGLQFNLHSAERGERFASEHLLLFHLPDSTPNTLF